MLLFSEISRPAQESVAAPSDINEMIRAGYIDVISGALNPPQQLAFQPSAPETGRALAASMPRRQYRASSGSKSYQLNVRVSGEERAAIKRYARQNRITVADAVRRAIAALAIDR